MMSPASFPLASRNFVELLQRRAELHGSVPACTFLVDGDSQEATWTYADLDRRARTIAAWLQAHGAVGQPVLLVYPQGLDFLAAFFGCLYAGAIAVPAYPPRRNRRAQRIECMVADAHVRWALTTQEILEQLNQSPADDGLLSRTQWQATDHLEFSADAWQPPRITEQTVALLQYTSGSIGTPKGVMVTHGNLFENQRLITHSFCQDSSIVCVGWLPLHHDMGLIGNMLHPLYHGGRFVFLSPVAFLQQPIRWLRAITRHRATIAGGPNFAFELCVTGTSAAQREGLDLSSWVVAFTGAERVHDATLRAFTDTFSAFGFAHTAFCPCYGLAESTLLTTGCHPGEPVVSYSLDPVALQQRRVGIMDAARLGDATGPVRSVARPIAVVGCGVPAPFVTVRIVNPDTMTACPPAGVGEIWVSGPTVAVGYWGQDAATRDTFGAQLANADPCESGQAYLRTGDFGFLQDGQLFVTGRLKDLIIVRGGNHYPSDLEQTASHSHLSLVPGSAAAFSVDVDDEEQVVIVQEVQREHLRRLDAAAVCQTIHDAIVDDHQIPLHAIMLVRPGAVPKTTSGKVQRPAARRMYLADEFTPVYHWLNTQSLPAVCSSLDNQCEPSNATRPESPTDESSRIELPITQREALQSLQRWILSRLSDRLGIPADVIDIHQPFARYGIDSLKAVRLTGELAEHLGRPIPPTLLYDYPNLSSLVRYLVLGSTQVAFPPPSTRSHEEPIAIVGLACRFPGSPSVNEYWTMLVEGRDGIGPAPTTRWQTVGANPCHTNQSQRPTISCGGYLERVDQFDAGFFGINAREADEMDPQQRLLLEVVWEAFEHAGIPIDSPTLTRTGVFVGVSGNEYAHLQASASHANNLYRPTGNSLAIVANRISFQFNFQGPSWSVDTACSSSLVAVHHACVNLRRGECDVAVAAGVSLIVSSDITSSLQQASMLSPTGRCHAFAAEADGFVRGEGCGVVLLKRLTQARADGDSILAIVRGSAVNQDGRSNGLTAPNALAQQAVLRLALADAQLAPADLDYVEAHGTGTALGDPIEMSALAAVFAPQRSATHPLQVGSVKTNLGHLEGAAGIAGLIKVTLALAHQHLPAHLHCQQLSPHIDWSQPVEVVRQARPWPTNPHRVRRAGVSSFGFGGTNAHVVLEEAPALPAPTATSAAEPAHVLLVLSAKTAPALAEQAAQWARVLTPDAPLADIAYTAAVGRAALAHRLAVIGDDPHTFQEQLKQFAQTHSAPQVLQAVAAAEHRVAWIIGETPLQAGAGDALARSCPRFRQHWEAARHECADMYSAATSHKTPDATLTSAQQLVLQVALGRFWLAMRVTPGYIVGLGQGELAAACLAGVLSLPAALRRLAVESSPEAERTDCAAQATYQRPTWPLFSAGRGTWVTDQVVTAAYWSEPLPRAMQVDATRASLQPSPPHMIVEFGTDTQLSQLVTDSIATDSATGPARFAGWPQGPNAWTAHLALCAHLFVHGVPVSAEAWTSGPRRRLSLPTYPFQRQRHWFQLAAPQEGTAAEMTVAFRSAKGAALRTANGPEAPLNDPAVLDRRSASTSSSVWVHPLLGWRLNLAGREIVYETDLAQVDYLADHRVGGTIVMPATGYLELALAAGRDASFKFLEIRDLKIRRPMLFDEPAAGRVQVVLAPDGGGFACRILRWTTDHWQAHATCRLEAEGDNSHTAEGALTPPALSDPEVSRSVAAHYAGCRAVGLEYGPAFQGVQALWPQGQGAARGSVALPSNVDARGYLVHPALLDACLQVISAAFPIDTPHAWLPLKLARYRVYERASQQTKFQVRANLRPVEADTRRTVDLSITDDQDQVVAEIVGLQLQRTALPTQPQLLFEERWVPQMRASDPVPTIPHATVARMAEHLESHRSTIVTNTGFESHLHALEAIEELCGHLICAQFAEQGQPFVVGQSFSLAELADAWHILPQHSRLLQRLLRILTEEQFVRPERDRWVVVTTLGHHDVEPQLSSLVNRSTSARPELELLQRCVSRLLDVLRGTVDPLRLLFPADASTSAADIYRDSVGGRTMNTLVAEAAASLAAELPTGRTLRVLEIGAGTGATTEAILQRLVPERTRYLFTDVAASFLPVARTRFADRANMDFRVLDIERDPLTQGFDAGSFDLVVAANVLHATQDLRTAVKHAASLLAPGGRLVVLEGTRPVRWLDLIFGLTSGWWRFEDHTLRPDYPLLSLDAWRRLLDEVGFGAIRVVPPLSPQRYHHDDPGSAVILAEFDATSVQLTGAQQPVMRRSWWICADDSRLFAALANGNEEHQDITQIPQADLVRSIEPGTLGTDAFDGPPYTDNTLSLLFNAPLPTDIVFAAFSPKRCEPRDPAEWALRQTCALLHIVQALEQRRHGPDAASHSVETPGTVRLWVVTCGAQLPSEATESLPQASLWGFLRTVAQEHPHWDCRLVDLDPDEPDTARMSTLLDELRGPTWDCESEVRFRNGVRQARRLLRYATAEVPGHQQVLKVTSRGSLSGLNIASEPRREPSANDVELEVHASGLNFRDVLSLLGQYPGTPPLGAECAGRIARLGEAVTDLNVGDRVVAIAPDTFRSHVVVHRQSVVRIPDGLSLEDAATIPVAYLTALVALFELTQLRAGMRVLIHTATGGVGLAAVHLARAAGAEIFATASLAKQEVLRQLGIRHIYDSRRVGFAEQIRDATNGQGVDVVLNTLGPEFATENVHALAEGGTYVDLTKASPEVAASIESARGHLTYHILDLAALLTAEPARIKTSLTPLLSRVSAGELAALPRRAFALEDAEQAFRTMRAAQHIGKILLRPTQATTAFPQRSEDRTIAQKTGPATLVRGNATYLVTGGLGGLGLALARWLTEKGAGRVALMARRAPTDAEQRSLTELQQTGAHVELYLGDVARATDVASVIQSIRSTGRPLAGVFHLAGTLDDGFVQSQTVTKMARVFSAKACGAWLLHQATLKDSLDHFVLFSSAAAAFGSAGQANHAAANAFMDALARHRHAMGLVGQSINWGPWSGIGAAAARDVAQRVGLDGIGMLTPAEGIRLFEHVLTSRHPQLLAVRLEWDRLPARWKSLPLFALLSEPKGPTREADQGESTFRSRLNRAPAQQRYQLLLSHLQALAAQTLGVKDPASLPTDQALADVGLDSLASLELSHRMEESLSTHISSTFVFDYPTLSDMAAHLVQTFSEMPDTVAAQAPETLESALAEIETNPDDDPGDDTSDYSPTDADTADEEVSQELQELTQELDRWGQN